jgi:non-canonical purine NTP pyrophosphatase (RdgB/HAM1 family)
MNHNLVFITGNPKKAAQVQKFVPFPLEHQKLDLAEIQSLDVEEVVEHKVKEAFTKLQKPILVHDASLTFLSLGKLPGPFVKWFLEEIGNEGLCKLVTDETNREALAEVAYGIYDGKTFHKILHRVKGTIPDMPRGENGFGWDPIFIPEGYDKTYAEMSDEELQAAYILTQSLRKLEEFLKNEYK